MMFFLIKNTAIAGDAFDLFSVNARKLTQCGNPQNLPEATLKAAGIYPQWREEGAPTLGYEAPKWEPENERVAIYLSGTQAERDAAAREQYLATLSCTPLQARLELIAQGLWDSVQAWAVAQGGTVQAFFEDALDWQFNDPSFQAGIIALGLTEAQAIAMMESARTR